MSYGGSPALTFGSAGYVTTPYPPNVFFPVYGSTASVPQPDGKLIVVGSQLEGGVGTFAVNVEGFSARRYNIDGSLDATFDVNSLFNSPSLSVTGNSTSGPRYAEATGVALQADGSILVVGNVSNVAKVVRLTPLGALDTTFGTGGIVTLGTAGSGDTPLDYAQTVAVLPGGGIAVGGAVERTAGIDSPAVEVLNSDGSVHSTYGNGGVAIVPVATNAQGFAPLVPVVQSGSYAFPLPISTVVQPDGKIVIDADAILLGSSPNTEIISTRLGVGGQLDPTYGMLGHVLITPGSILPGLASVSATTLAIQPDGKLVLGGTVSTSTPGVPSNMLAYRLNSDGTTDSTFGIKGADIFRSVAPYGAESGAIAIEADGKILLADRNVANFFRLDANGLPDPTFGEGGISVLYYDGTTAVNGYVTPATTLEPGTAGIDVMSTGKLLVAETDPHASLVRLLENGSSGDYNGDGIADPAIYIASQGVFAYKSSGVGAGPTIAFGSAGAGQSLPAPGAYAGSGEDELALYLPAAGAFAVQSLTSGVSTLTKIGTPGPGNALPAPGDYDLSGKTEYAVYQPATGSFLYRPANGGPDVTVPFGIAGAGQSIPVPADYFGTGQTDFAVYLVNQGAYLIRNPISGQDYTIPFGPAGAGQSIPVPADYDGVGHADLAVYIPSLGQLIYRPANGGPDVAVPFGSKGAEMTLPSPGDYSGSGKDEAGAYLPAFGTFAYRPAAGGADVVFPFGVAGQTIPFDLASDLATSGSGSGSGFSVHVDSASVDVPLTSDLLDSLAAPTLKKKVGHA